MGTPASTGCTQRWLNQAPSCFKLGQSAGLSFTACARRLRFRWWRAQRRLKLLQTWPERWLQFQWMCTPASVSTSVHAGISFNGCAQGALLSMRLVSHFFFETHGALFQCPSAGAKQEDFTSVGFGLNTMSHTKIHCRAMSHWGPG